MGLSNELISQFAKLTKSDKKTKTETTVYGKTVVHNGTVYVQLDGSNVLTPISTTADVNDGERVMVSIKNHTATITGNVSSPAARTEDVANVTTAVSGLENIMAYKVTAEDIKATNAIFDSLKTKLAEIDKLTAAEAYIDNLIATFAELTHVTANDVDILNAEIENLKVKIGEFTDVSVVNGYIENLKSKTAEFTYVSADFLNVIKGYIEELEVKKLDTESADIGYAKIDQSNIDKAWIDELYSKSGLIQFVTSEDMTVTGHLVGVTIKGDLIEGGTIKADKLVIKDSTDGLYYKLNFESGAFTNAEEVPADGLHGSIIVANSITADKVSVSDLVAFGATIGGFFITDNAIYSGGKDTYNSDAVGSYLDKEGQFAFGDSDNYIRYYKTTDENGNEIYKLEISAESLKFGSSKKYSMSDVQSLAEKVKIGTYEDPETGEVEPCVELSEGDTDFKQILTNTKAVFMDGSEVGTQLDAEGLSTKNAVIEEELRLGEFIWSRRPNGNCGIMWKEATS